MIVKFHFTETTEPLRVSFCPARMTRELIGASGYTAGLGAEGTVRPVDHSRAPSTAPPAYSEPRLARSPNITTVIGPSGRTRENELEVVPGVDRLPSQTIAPPLYEGSTPGKTRS